MSDKAKLVKVRITETIEYTISVPADSPNVSTTAINEFKMMGKIERAHYITGQPALVIEPVGE